MDNNVIESISDSWNKLESRSRVRITAPARLGQIVLVVGDWKLTVTLEIEEPRNLTDLQFV